MIVGAQFIAPWRGDNQSGRNELRPGVVIINLGAMNCAPTLR